MTIADTSDKFKINLNQNLWVLIVSYAAVGLSQRYGFHQLWWMAYIWRGLPAYRWSLASAATPGTTAAANSERVIREPNGLR